MNIKELSDAIVRETEKVIVGKSDRIRLITMAVLAGGHVLLDDLPGVGKTTLVKTMARALGLSQKRVQFVPDMLPSDITGMQIFNQKTGDFELREGPVMTNILLADEINRAIPRTQAALLEAMEERQVSIDGEIRKLPEPFVVLATQNPVEAESTFRLPAAQMDRFLIRTGMGYPGPEEERSMLRLLSDDIPFESVEPVTDAAGIAKAAQEASRVHVSDHVTDYIIRIANATRNDRELRAGISPRATRALYRASRVWAAMEGRDYVTPDDIRALAQPVLGHRLMLSNNAQFSGRTAEGILDGILGSTEASPDAVSVLSGER